jgi:hypothetical protein
MTVALNSDFSLLVIITYNIITYNIITPTAAYVVMLLLMMGMVNAQNM